MNRTVIIFLIAACMLLPAVLSPKSVHESTVSFIQMVYAMYPKSVPIGSIPGYQPKAADFDGTNFDRNEATLLWFGRVTKDGIDTVTAYYSSLMGPYDLVKNTPPNQINHWYKYTSYIFSNYYSNKDGICIDPVACVTVIQHDSQAWLAAHTGGTGKIADFTDDHLLPFPLVMMKKLIGTEGHTAAEYAAFFYKYYPLAQMYSIFTKTGEADYTRETDMIYKKYFEAIFPGTPVMDNNQFIRFAYSAYALSNIVQPKGAWEKWAECLDECELASYPVYIIHDGVWK